MTIRCPIMVEFQFEVPDEKIRSEVWSKGFEDSVDEFFREMIKFANAQPMVISATGGGGLRVEAKVER